MSEPEAVRVLIASALEAEHVRRITGVDPRIEVLYAPELLPVPRYQSDHHGPPRDLTADQDDRWTAMLASADISFDFDWRAPADMAANCPHLRWVQATSSGIGQFMERTGLDRNHIVFTTAAGVHATPLAEFALTGLLYFTKELPYLAGQQREHSWQRYTTRQLAGRRVVVVGLGQVGRKVAALLTAVGAEVWGVARDASRAEGVTAARVAGISELDSLLPAAEALILCCPLTAETQGLISARRLGLLPRGAVLVNISRGQVIDEDAMTEALSSGQLGGAFLDVAAVEPLPKESPLWDMPTVVISPHSASTVEQENEVITDIFCGNLRSWLDGRPLRNVYSRDKGY
jgi:glyoxylate/hydroxypyruvate reductase